MANEAKKLHVAGKFSGGVTVPTASVGQTIKVKSVDENGKPTEWEAVDFPAASEIPEQVQPDWNESNDISPAFIKNRPGGYDAELLVETISNHTLSPDILYEATGSYYFLTHEYNILLDGLTTYTVIWNNEEYVVTAVAGDLALGNYSLLDPSKPDTGEPFLFYYGKVYSIINAPATFSVYTSGGIQPVPFDEKFIPKSVKLPSVTTSDAGKFLRVSSKGKWEAQSIPNAEEASF